MELSKRECGISQCIYSGMSNKQIGIFYFLAAETVRNHITAIIQKTGSTDRTQVALWWWRYAVSGKEEPVYNNGDGELTKSQKRSLQYRAVGKMGKSWRELLLEFGGKCLKCGSSENITRDHVVPLSKGGSPGLENVQPLCRSCNSKKGNKTIDYR